MAEPYSPPLDGLLTLGDPGKPRAPWPDYLAMGITREHIPELIRMLTDRELNEAATESVEVWAPLHAWRTLGRLRAGEAAGPLAEMLATSTIDDWAMDELPLVLGMIGRAAIAPSLALLDDEYDFIQLPGISTLGEVAKAHPELRGEVAGILTERLGRWRDQDPELNAYLIDELAQLGEATAAPLMREAFGADAVDLSWCGDWEDAQVRLGLMPERITPRQRAHDFPAPVKPAAKRPPKPPASDRKRRKNAKAARKRNRRK